VLAPVLLALALSTPASPEALEQRRADIAREILQLAGRIQREIEAMNASALLDRVPPEGLRCGEQLVPRERVEHDLRAKDSWLHAVFFGGAAACAPPGQPASLWELFAVAKEIQVVVAFRADPRSEVGLPCFDYRARDTITPGAPFCFERRDGKWWFAQSLYPC